MENILVELLALASVIAVFVSAITEAFKKALPNFPVKFIPLTALVFGILIGFLASVSFPLDTPLSYMLWAGGIAGLASVGLFEGTKNIIKK